MRAASGASAATDDPFEAREEVPLGCDWVRTLWVATRSRETRDGQPNGGAQTSTREGWPTKRRSAHRALADVAAWAAIRVWNLA